MKRSIGARLDRYHLVAETVRRMHQVTGLRQKNQSSRVRVQISERKHRDSRAQVAGRQPVLRVADQGLPIQHHGPVQV